MSFVTNSLDFFYGRIRTVILFFLLSWIFAGFCLGVHTFKIKRDIKEQRLSTVQSALNSYLLRQSSSAGYQFTSQHSPPSDLDFIRISREKNQLLISSENRMVFKGLVELTPSSHGAWIDILQPDQSGSWILVSKSLRDGSVIQAGMDDSATGIAIYRKSVATAYLLFLLAALPSLCFAYLLRYLTNRPLQTLSTHIKYGLEHKQATLPEGNLRNNDLGHVYQLLEQTFSQNRHLIYEMQSSLDNVAHDLRTPMTRLRAVAEYALQADKEDHKLYRDALSDCLEESERVLSMLKVMMSVAEAEAGTMRLHPEKINLLDTVEDVMGLYQYVAEEEQISVSCDLAESDIFIFADKTRISQVWANLLDNAIKYGHASGHVAISIKAIDSNVIIRFCDDGMGISESEALRIWDRLYRGDRSRSKQGLGLGLNYVKAVVEAHNGQVTLSSRIREGSCFEVQLPAGASGATQHTEITN